ncbi:MAG: hypothetical protein Q8L85_08520 [Alphaproteobacteria bacterium]|nr:hypothetical protein [Alphaproteobacteria bacterium]
MKLKLFLASLIFSVFAHQGFSYAIGDESSSSSSSSSSSISDPRLELNSLFVECDAFFTVLRQQIMQNGSVQDNDYETLIEDAIAKNLNGHVFKNNNSEMHLAFNRKSKLSDLNDAIIIRKINLFIIVMGHFLKGTNEFNKNIHFIPIFEKFKNDLEILRNRSGYLIMDNDILAASSSVYRLLAQLKQYNEKTDEAIQLNLCLVDFLCNAKHKNKFTEKLLSTLDPIDLILKIFTYYVDGERLNGFSKFNNYQKKFFNLYADRISDDFKEDVLCIIKDLALVGKSDHLIDIIGILPDVFFKSDKENPIYKEIVRIICCVGEKITFKDYTIEKNRIKTLMGYLEKKGIFENILNDDFNIIKKNIDLVSFFAKIYQDIGCFVKAGKIYEGVGFLKCVSKNYEGAIEHDEDISSFAKVLTKSAQRGGARSLVFLVNYYYDVFTRENFSNDSLRERLARFKSVFDAVCVELVKIVEAGECIDQDEIYNVLLIIPLIDDCDVSCDEVCLASIKKQLRGFGTHMAILCKKIVYSLNVVFSSSSSASPSSSYSPSLGVELPKNVNKAPSIVKDLKKSTKSSGEKVKAFVSEKLQKGKKGGKAKTQKNSSGSSSYSSSSSESDKRSKRKKWFGSSSSADSSSSVPSSVPLSSLASSVSLSNLSIVSEAYGTNMPRADNSGMGQSARTYVQNLSLKKEKKKTKKDDSLENMKELDLQASKALNKVDSKQRDHVGSSLRSAFSYGSTFLPDFATKAFRAGKKIKTFFGRVKSLAKIKWRPDQIESMVTKMGGRFCSDEGKGGHAMIRFSAMKPITFKNHGGDCKEGALVPLFKKLHERSLEGDDIGNRIKSILMKETGTSDLDLEAEAELFGLQENERSFSSSSSYDASEDDDSESSEDTSSEEE